MKTGQTGAPSAALDTAFWGTSDLDCIWAGAESGRRRTGRPGRKTLFVILGLLLLAGLAGEEAQAQGAGSGNVSLQEITWAHPDPARVVRFVVYLSATPGSEQSARQVDVGKPSSVVGSGGSALRYFSAVVPARFDDFVAVAAVAPDGSHSPLSAWRGVPPGQPGTPGLLEP